MTREECEAKLCEKVKEIWEIYSEYNPTGYSLSLHTTKNGLILVNNEYWDSDKYNQLRKEIRWEHDD